MLRWGARKRKEAVLVAAWLMDEDDFAMAILRDDDDGVECFRTSTSTSTAQSSDSVDFGGIYMIESHM